MITQLGLSGKFIDERWVTGGNLEPNGGREGERKKKGGIQPVLRKTSSRD